MSSTSEIVHKLISEKFQIQAGLIRPEMKLKKDLGLDSLDVIELIIDLEKELKVSLPEDAVDTFDSVYDVIQCLEKNV